MSLSSLQLDAFMEVIRLGSFSAAAKSLCVTQSALSQRVQNLERELEATVIIRGEKELKMTPVGEKLWNYGRGKDALEKEFLSEMAAPEGTIIGTVNIGSFSTYTRSKLIPKISIAKQQNPAINYNVATKEIRELPNLLRSGVFDFIFSTEKISKQSIECVEVGQEKNVLIESSNHVSAEIYIDHDEFDTTSKEFWSLQKKSPSDYNQIYFDEIYSIIDAVAYGHGKAVVPLHLIENDKRIKVITGLKPLTVPIYLCHHRQPIATKLHNFVKSILAS